MVSFAAAASTSIRSAAAFVPRTNPSTRVRSASLLSRSFHSHNACLLRRKTSAACFKRHRPWEEKLSSPPNRAIPSLTYNQFHRARALFSSSTSVSSKANFEDDLIANWRTDPTLTDVYHLPTLSVPAESVHSILKNGSIVAPYLASNISELKGIHPRVKLVRDILTSSIQDKDDMDNPSSSSTKKKRKLILLDAHQTIPPEVQQELNSLNILPGPPFELPIPQEQQTPHRILEKILPADAQPPPTGYEQVGHVLHLNLKPHHEPYGRLIGDVLLDKLSPSVETVVTKVGEVKGPYRTYDMEVLAGRPSTDVTVVEHGIRLHFDLSQVYWSTRLSGQRTRSLDEDILPGQIIADAFCGVGALCARAAVEKNCTVVANDLNPAAIEYCRANALQNGVDDKIQVVCGDANEFITSLGHSKDRPLPHHLMLNFPLASVDFLHNIKHWPIEKLLEGLPTVHVYTFARGDAETNKTPADVSKEMVAIGLLPSLGASGEDSVKALADLVCNVRAREVRDVAPGKVVMWVTFQVTRDLLQVMQA